MFGNKDNVDTQSDLNSNFVTELTLGFNGIGIPQTKWIYFKDILNSTLFHNSKLSGSELWLKQDGNMVLV